MEHMRKYDYVERLGKDEVDGILNGTCYIFEKIDGEIIERTFYDFIQEEIWDILKKKKYPTINFRLLKKIATNKTRTLFFQHLERDSDV